MKITVLNENTSISENYFCEHGLSLYIEANGKHILFDMGQTDIFSENAKKLGIDLSTVDFAVLSHGHYDHGGGLKAFLEINQTAPVYINRYAFGDYYNGTEKYIGLDKSLINSGRIIFTDDEYVIDGNFSLFSCNSKEKIYADIPSGLNEKNADSFVPDAFLHEQYLEIKENGRKILISGCSHKGIMNITEWFSPDILIGGFHFSKLPLDESLESYAKTLANTKTSYFTCHCTGNEQYEFMKKIMNNIKYIKTGEVFFV